LDKLEGHFLRDPGLEMKDLKLLPLDYEEIFLIDDDSWVDFPLEGPLLE